VSVTREEDTREAEAAADFVAEGSLWEIHCVGDCKNDQTAVAQARPVEEIVHDALVLGDELVELVHEDYAGNSPWAWLVELSF